MSAEIQLFLTLVVSVGYWTTSSSGRFTSKALQYPVDRRLGGPRTGMCGEEKILLYQDSNSDHSAAQPVAYYYTDSIIPTIHIMYE
jgi:hypothetical protein